jgi:2-polyprenyl-3-methyl-5-hydroxy-6-metoxy-1,4-benzoquinol methylase
VITSAERLEAEWTREVAPKRGDIHGELLEDAAAFFGISLQEARERARDAGERFRAEWQTTAPDPTDDQALTRFYNQSDTELFELINWHASDPIHHRTIVLRDFASGFPGRELIDYGSGIGNDALVFAQAGFQVTLADISDPLLAFAAWRCRSRGLNVRTIDLKVAKPPHRAFDAAVCFDVLEHIPRPLTVVRQIRASLKDGGIFVLHAPFGLDDEHPMHVVHRDVVTPRMRSLGFEPLSCEFPASVRAPQIYRKRHLPALDRLAYFVYDGYLDGSVGSRLAAMYRAGRSMMRPEER